MNRVSKMNKSFLHALGRSAVAMLVTMFAVSVAHASELYFTNVNAGVITIEKINTDGSGRTTILNRTATDSITDISAIRVDAAANKMFWVEDRPDHVTKWRLMSANLDGSGVTNMYSEILSGGATSVTLDTINQRVYFLKASGNEIRSYNYNGTGGLLNWSASGYDPDPSGLAINAATGKLYMSQRNNATTTGVFEILQMDTDGTNQIVRAAPRAILYDLIIDPDTDLAYYTRRQSATDWYIAQFNQDGPLNEDANDLSGTLQSSGTRPLTLDTAADLIYYSALDGTIYVTDLNGNQSVFLPGGSGDVIRGLDVAVIPEPGSLALLTLGGVMAALRRQCKRH